MFDVTHNFIPPSPVLTQFRGNVSLPSFCPEGFIGIGVTIDTDAFVRNFVVKTCRDITDDVEKETNRDIADVLRHIIKNVSVTVRQYAVPGFVYYESIKRGQRGLKVPGPCHAMGIFLFLKNRFLRESLKGRR